MINVIINMFLYVFLCWRLVIVNSVNNVLLCGKIDVFDVMFVIWWRVLVFKFVVWDKWYYVFFNVWSVMFILLDVEFVIIVSIWMFNVFEMSGLFEMFSNICVIFLNSGIVVIIELKFIVVFVLIIVIMDFFVFLFIEEINVL